MQSFTIFEKYNSYTFLWMVKSCSTKHFLQASVEKMYLNTFTRVQVTNDS